LARSAAFAVLVPITLVGAAAIGAHVFAKWVPYYVYRVGGKDWPADSHFLTRLMCFLLLCVLVGLATGFGALWSWTAAALLAWNVFRARQDLLTMLASAERLKPLERDTSPCQPIDTSPLESKD
jgi:hypothetical protein